MQKLKKYQVTRIIYLCDEVEANNENEAQLSFEEKIDKMPQLEYAKLVDSCICEHEVYQK